jgi:Leucine-rich repeat (LRR) protein
MPEGIADRIQRYSGTKELRQIDDIEDIAKLNVDEIKYLATEKGLAQEDIEKYVTMARERLETTTKELPEIVPREIEVTQIKHMNIKLLALSQQMLTAWNYLSNTTNQQNCKTSTHLLMDVP